MAISKIDSGGIAASGITADSLDIGQIGGRRNLIINGAMQVAQRGTSFTSNGYTVDRFSSFASAGTLGRTMTQSSTAPSGFSSSLKIVASTAETDFTGTEYAIVRHPVEAQNLQQLDYGSSGAKSVTLSFWVRSNVTGNYAITMYHDDAGKIIGSTYTISSANTWEYKTITFVGNTADSIANDNGVGLRLDWSLAAGSDRTTTDNTSWGANATGNQAYGHTAQWGEATNDEWYITGVQLEVGSVATPFEHRSYGEELALCQRYFWRQSYSTASEGVIQGGGFNTNEFYTPIRFSTIMRSAPTCSVSNASHFQVLSNNAAQTPSSFSFSAQSTYSVTLLAAVTITLGHYGWLRFGNSSAYIQADAEL